MSAVTVGGDLVHYETLGRGRAVVLLHSWVGNWRYWVPSMQQLHLKYKVFALDMFGFGDSAKNLRRYTLDEQVRMVGEFLDALQLKKVALVGHGLGAWVAAELAKRSPEAVARMLLISTPLFTPDDLLRRRPPRPQRPVTKPLNRAALEALDKTIYNAADFRRATPLASLGRGGYDDKPDSRPRQPVLTDPSDPTIPNPRMLQRAKQDEAARNAAGRTVIPGAGQTSEDNPLYRALAGQEPSALLAKTVRRLDQQYEKLTQDVSRTDPRVLTQTALYYDSGALLDTLRVLSMPVMMVHGESDPLIPPPEEAVWNYLTQDKEDLCVPVPLPAGHFPMFDFESFNRLLGGFLDAEDISKMEIRERWRRRSR
jgi:pimeloyl-ACP methyl ester carboxylesterase